MHGHVPVMTDALLALLAPRPGEIAVDCTVGRGGHAEALARAVAPDGAGDGTGGGRVVGFDLDAGNLEYATGRLAARPFTAVHDSFVRVPAHLRRLGVRADVLVADLGFSSNQMTDPVRGFTFGGEGPLDMRFDARQPLTAADLLESLDQNELADLIRRYGEDPLAGKIARKLVHARGIEPIQTTTRLAALVAEAYGSRARTSRLHPATRTFMALRIAVNDELAALECLLDLIAREAAATPPRTWLGDSARIAVISFHSLEDRLTKRAFAALEADGRAERLTRRPLGPDEQETRANPRARSARLRAIRTTAGGRNEPAR